MFKNLIIIILMGLSCATFADRLVLSADKDNTLFETTDGSTSNGAGDYLFIGLTNGAGLRRSVVSFDLSELNSCDQIDAVRVIFSIDRASGSAQPGVATLHTLLQDWGEGSSNAGSPGGQGTDSESGDATWIHAFFDTQNWNTAGGDFMSQASASAPFIAASDDVLNFTTTDLLVDDVRAWVNNPDSNYGWILLGDEVTVLSARRLLSRENSNEGSPTLLVDFTPGAECIFASSFEVLL